MQHTLDAFIMFTLYTDVFLTRTIHCYNIGKQCSFRGGIIGSKLIIKIMIFIQTRTRSRGCVLSKLVFSLLYFEQCLMIVGVMPLLPLLLQ